MHFFPQADTHLAAGANPRLLRVCALTLALLSRLHGADIAFPLAEPATVAVSPTGLDDLGRLLQASVDRGDHAGFVSVIARDGRIVDFRTIGVRDVASAAPMRSDTILRLYSMTKVIVAVAALAAVEDGRLSLDDPVARHLPDLAALQVMTGGTAAAPVLEPAVRPITVRQLLTHTGGFTYDILHDDALAELYRAADLWSAPTTAEFVARAARLPLRAQPGTAFHYSIGTDVLGAVLEKVEGEDLGAILRRRILGPLGMVDTAFAVPEAKRPRLAALARRGAGGKLEPAPPILGVHAEPNRGFMSGGAGLFSTAGDYLRFAQMLANGGELFGTRILKPETVELMTRNHLAGLARPTHEFSPGHGWGLGVEVELDPATGGFGWCGAATTYVRISRRERSVMLLFAQHLPFNEHSIFAPFVAAARAAVLPPVTPEPAPLTVPQINVWHGMTQRTGQRGAPQPDFNLLGAVTFPDNLTSLTWSLNGGPPQPLDVAPDRRIARRGDFNAELPLTQLRPGLNTVRLAARWAARLADERTVTLDYRPGPPPPLPQRVRWREVADLQDVGQVTDGHWRVTPDGLRTVTPGYDRVFLIGDATWRDYEATGTVTFHGFPEVGARTSGRVRHAGFCLRWQGNTAEAGLPPGRPKPGLHPRGGLTWLTYREGAPLPQREFYPGDSEAYSVFAPLVVRVGERIRLRARCVSEPDTPTGEGVTIYRLRAWRDGDPEPTTWDYEVRQVSARALRTGGLALVAHEADVTFGDLDIEPL
jgi:CubicO group peptidase (beta-lactamase class C family)